MQSHRSARTAKEGLLLIATIQSWKGKHTLKFQCIRRDSRGRQLGGYLPQIVQKLLRLSAKCGVRSWKPCYRITNTEEQRVIG